LWKIAWDGDFKRQSWADECWSEIATFIKARGSLSYVIGAKEAE